MRSISFLSPLRFAGTALASLLVAVVLVSPAHADPHAVFYTVTGQQQLFFNVLAALNQANFVEPAQNTTGAPTGSSRQEVLDQRVTAGFTEEKDPKVNATKTNLDGIVTRNITLEGNDLWSAYVAMQFALERARTTASNEITKIYCERGLGLEDCAADSTSAQKGQDLAFDNHPDETALQPFRRGVGIYASGLKEYDDRLKQEPGKKNEEVGPLPYNEAIAQLRNQNSQQDDKKKQIIEDELNSVAHTFVANPVDPNVYDGITFNSDGSVSIDDKSIDTLTAYMQKFDQISSHPLSLLETGIGGAESIKDFYDASSVTGAGGGKGDLVAYKDGAEVKAKVTLPATVKEELAKGPVNQIATVEQNRTYVPPAQNARPEGVQELSPESKTGNVAGISSDQRSGKMPAANIGQVAGVTSEDPTSDPAFHSATKELDPGLLPEAFHHEPAPTDYLKALGIGKSSGCGCSLHDAVNNFGQAIIQRINQF